MQVLMNRLISSLRAFAADEEGAQVVEYALVIALVSIGLALALDTALETENFNSFVQRVTACLAGTECAAPI